MNEKKMAKTIVTYGKTYEPAVLPIDIQRGKTGDCFDWCAYQAARNKRYTYVEGFASNPEDPEKGYIYHAWLTDGKYAFDPTWKAIKDGVERPLPTHYIGIAFDINDVAKFMTTTGYKALFANQRRAQTLFNRILKRSIGVVA